MAGLAFFAKPTLVTLLVVVFLVTGDTLRWRTLEGRVAMAVFARHIDMLAGEREFCLAVVEARVLPVLVGVAVGAGITQFALVLVVFAVAGNAIGWCFTILLALDVAVAALHLGNGMAALQHEISELVIELFFIKWSDVHVTPFVIGVALAAFLLYQASVITLLLDGVLGDVLVAVKTQTALRTLFKACMALLAVRLDLGMAFNHLAGHDHALDRICVHPGETHSDQDRQPDECKT